MLQRGLGAEDGLDNASLYVCFEFYDVFSFAFEEIDYGSIRSFVTLRLVFINFKGFDSGVDRVVGKMHIVVLSIGRTRLLERMSGKPSKSIVKQIYP